MNLPIQFTCFSAQTLFKSFVFQKTCFYFLLFTQFQFYCEEFWESTYKESCSRSHTVLRLIGFIVIIQRERLYKSVFGLKRSCTRCCCLLGLRRVVYIWQRGIVKWCTRCWFWVYKIKGKENLKRVAWGLDAGQEDWTRIKSFVFAFALFLSFYSVHFLSYKLFVIDIY